ncbi:MAG TPA: TonB-dependent receptor [Bacteroidales bacterium]|nr:TonB-dependent receptor [Bacteroidales bacterium]
MEKIYLLFILILLPFLTLAQEQKVQEISPVVVESNKKFFSDDHTTLTINSESNPVVQHENVGYLLSRKSPLITRNYGGYGSLTSVSMHGTGSNHTQVTWNGIPLNSPTTGQADLSLLPAGFVHRIEVINGASGSLYGSGTFGGSVNLDNEPDWNNRFTTQYSFNIGSYGHLGHLIALQAGKSKIQYNISFIKSEADNNFYFKDIYWHGSPLRKNTNNQYSDAGILQNVYINAGKGNYFEAGTWYQKKILRIPAVMGSYETSNARQKDSLFRAYISYRKNGEKSAFHIRSAYLSDYLNYVNGKPGDSLAFIDSRINTSRILNETEYRHFITKRLIAGGGLSYSLITGESANYISKIKETETAFYGNLKYIYKDFILNTGFRKEFYRGLNPLPQFSAGIRFMPHNDLAIRVTLSTKFRKPTLNEKYWRPGGNPDLRPEKGLGGELSTEWNILNDIRGNQHISVKLTAYYQSVDNWIQWILKDSLTPVEYKKVHASGIETWIDFSFLIYPISVSGFLNYNFNRSVIKETYDGNPIYKGNQLIYVPSQSSRASAQIKYGNVLLDISCVYTGIRETVETGNRSLQLPPYTVFDASVGYSVKFSSMPFGIWFRCDNLLNKQYEIIRSYPVPGRTFQLVLSLGFSRNNEQ